MRGNRLAIVLLGLSAGSGGRVALAFLKKNMDTCFKGSEEIDSVKPSLAKLPDLRPAAGCLPRRRSHQMLAFAGVLTIGVILIFIFSVLLCQV